MKNMRLAPRTERPTTSECRTHFKQSRDPTSTGAEVAAGGGEVQLTERDLRGGAPPGPHGVSVDRYEFSPLACCGLNVSGVITDINLAGAALLGSPKETIVGRSIASFVVPTDLDVVHAHIRSCVARGMRTTTETRVRSASGPETPVQIISVPLGNPSVGEVTLITALLDVSSSKSLCKLVQDLRSELATTLLFATRMLLPLAPIDPTEARKVLEHICETVSRMRQRIDACRAVQTNHTGARAPWNARHPGDRDSVQVNDDDIERRPVAVQGMELTDGFDASMPDPRGQLI